MATTSDILQYPRPLLLRVSTVVAVTYYCLDVSLPPLLFKRKTGLRGSGTRKASKQKQQQQQSTL